MDEMKKVMDELIRDTKGNLARIEDNYECIRMETFDYDDFNEHELELCQASDEMDVIEEAYNYAIKRGVPFEMVAEAFDEEFGYSCWEHEDEE